jgi:uncharacterized ferritin-like protein (DUF455 family)
MSAGTPDWSPFQVDARRKPGKMRPLSSVEGVRDRLRTAAFAEIQAREAFLWAAERFDDAPAELRDAWRELAGQEHKHLSWLLERLEQLGGTPDEAPVSDRLWEALRECASAEDFAVLIAKAEERGRRAGVTIGERLAKSDPETAGIFAAIADEEIAHVDLAHRFYPEASAPPDLSR